MSKKIAMRELLSLQNCGTSLRYERLQLKSSSSGTRTLLKYKVFSKIKECLANGIGESDCINQVKELILDGYCIDWFVIDIQMHEAMESDIAKSERLIRYLYDVVGFIYKVDAPYVIEMNGVKYRGEVLGNVTGKVDIVFVNKKTSRIECVVFKDGKPILSKRARSDKNNPKYSMELAAIKLGFYERFPNCVPSFYHFDSKRDKSDYVAEFEEKTGDNIVAEDFFNMSFDEVNRNFQKSSTFKMCDDCENCRHKNVCKFPREIRVDEEKKNENQKNVSKRTELTVEQERVVHHTDGPMNVIAVPGAGKTFCLVQRMKYLKEQGVNPRNMLFVTFTNKACDEIKSRVMKELGTTNENELPCICTFNGFGYSLLKENPAIVGKRVKLAETSDRLSLIRELLSSVRLRGASTNGIYEKYGLLARVDKMIQDIETSGKEAFFNSYRDKIKIEDLYQLYDLFRQKFEERGLCSYDMQISLCIDMLKRVPSLAKIYSRKYKYIMVDEFQDASADNAELIYLIAKHHNNIVVVGDDDQSIYAFRKGSNRFLLYFPEEFKNAETVIMADNFRSPSGVINASNALIQNNVERCQKEFICHQNGDGVPIKYQHFQIEMIGALVKEILKKGFEPGDIAILSKTNKNLIKVASWLDYNGIKSHSPKDYLIEDTVFLAIYDVLELCVKGYYSNDEAAYRLLSWCGCEEMIERPRKDKSLLENQFICCNMPFVPESEEEWDYYKTFLPADDMQNALKRIVMCFYAIHACHNMSYVFTEILKQIFHLEYHPVVRELERITEERAIVDVFHLYNFMKDLVLFHDTKRVGYGTASDCVNLFTCHDSKGKEFPVVIVYGTDEFSEDEEERRLLYVAMTRAMKVLILLESDSATLEISKEVDSAVKIVG